MKQTAAFLYASGTLVLLILSIILFRNGDASALPILAAALIFAGLYIFWARPVLHQNLQFRGLLETSPYATVITDRSGHIRIVNREAEALFGYSRGELKGQGIEMLMPPEYRERHAGHIIHFNRNPHTRPMGSGMELYAQKKDGSRFMVEISLSPLELSSERLITAVIRDVTVPRGEQARMQMFNEKLQSEVAAQTSVIGDMLNRISDGFVSFDKEWRFTYINSNAEIILQTPASALMGCDMRELYKNDGVDPLVEACQKALRTGSPVQLEIEQPSTGRWFMDHIYPGKQGFSIYFHDITESRVAQQKLLERERELSQLSAHLLRIREEERSRIAREIHDELGQQMTELKMDVVRVRKQKISEPVAAIISDMDSVIGSAVTSMRRIASNLRPGILDDLGLEAAAEWLCQEMQKRTEASIVFDSSIGDRVIATDAATTAFRVVQESLNNALKYAQARSIRVELRATDHALVLRIADDGKGFDAAALRRGRQFGIIGMRERVQALGGHFAVQSQPGKGTSLFIQINLS